MLLCGLINVTLIKVSRFCIEMHHICPSCNFHLLTMCNYTQDRLCQNLPRAKSNLVYQYLCQVCIYCLVYETLHKVHTCDICSATFIQLSFGACAMPFCSFQIMKIDLPDFQVVFLVYYERRANYYYELTSFCLVTSIEYTNFFYWPLCHLSIKNLLRRLLLCILSKLKLTYFTVYNFCNYPYGGYFFIWVSITYFLRFMGQSSLPF